MDDIKTLVSDSEFSEFLLELIDPMTGFSDELTSDLKDDTSSRECNNKYKHFKKFKHSQSDYDDAKYRRKEKNRLFAQESRTRAKLDYQQLQVELEVLRSRNMALRTGLKSILNLLGISAELSQISDIVKSTLDETIVVIP